MIAQHTKGAHNMTTKAQSRHSRFQRGTGAFACLSCHKQTRDTGDNGACQLCPVCYEAGSCENMLNDNYNIPFGCLSHCKTVDEVFAEAGRLEAEAKAKGGEA